MCHPEVGLVGGQPPVSPPQPRVLLLHSARRLDPSFPSQGGTAGSHPVVSGEWPGLAHVAYGHPPPRFTSPHLLQLGRQGASRSWPHVAEAMGDYTQRMTVSERCGKAKGLLKR